MSLGARGSPATWQQGRGVMNDHTDPGDQPQAAGQTPDAAGDAGASEAGAGEAGASGAGASDTGEPAPDAGGEPKQS